MPGKTISRNLSVVAAAHAFLFTLAISAAAQTTVPATARQAASMPAFQSRLARPTTSHMLKRTPLAGSSFSARRPLNDGDLYDNGPVNGQIDAWTIDFGYQVTNSSVAFVPSHGNPVLGVAHSWRHHHQHRGVGGIVALWNGPV